MVVTSLGMGDVVDDDHGRKRKRTRLHERINGKIVFQRHEDCQIGQPKE